MGRDKAERRKEAHEKEKGSMKWLIEKVRDARASVTLAATVVIDVANGAPLIAAIGRALHRLAGQG